MGKIRAIFIDLDDTLIATQKLYDDAIMTFARRLRRKGIAIDKAVEAIKKNSHELFDKYGYSKERLPEAFEKTLRDFFPHAGQWEYTAARKLAENVFSGEAEMYPEAGAALMKLSRYFDLHLVTQGDEQVQKKRISDLRYSHLFDSKNIVPAKSKEVFEKLMKKHGYKPDEVIMIGDSLKSDIKPAHEAGMGAVLIPRNNWKLNEQFGHEAAALKAKVYEDLEKAADAILKDNGYSPRSPSPWGYRWPRKKPDTKKPATTSAAKPKKRRKKGLKQGRKRRLTGPKV